MRVAGIVLAFLTFGCAALPAPQPVPDVQPDDDPLTLAAECLARGDEPAAATHFETYIRRHPEQLIFRVHLADLLFKLQRLNEAKVQYERFIADAQDATGAPRDRLVHC